MLETRDLVKIYRPKKGVPVKALDGVTLKFPDKGMVFLLGKSGSGKSTLLNILGGLDRYNSGEILIKGVSSKKFRQSHFDSYRNTYVGFIFQEYNILEEYNVGANIALALQLQGKKATDEAINEILHKVDLDGYGTRKPNELSGGQKQRVAIARALVKSPEIIMADEPTGALDSATGRQVLETLRSLSKEKLVIVVSHDRDFAEKYADRIVELADGKVIRDVTRTAVPEEEAEELKYEGSTVTVPEGYHLTEEDRLAINAYVDSLKGSELTLEISRSSGLSRFFRPTDPAEIEQKGGAFRLIRSRLPFRHAFRLGGSSLKNKKIRLVFTILLSCIAFGLFALADTMAAYDPITTYTNSIVDSGIRYAAMTKRVIYGDFTSDRPLTDLDLENLVKATGGDLTGVYTGNYNLSLENLGFDEMQYSEETAAAMALYMQSLGGFAEIDEDMLKKSGVNLIEGRMPTAGTNEIVLSTYLCQSFLQWGYTPHTSEIWEDENGTSHTDYYVNSEENKKENLRSVSELLGKELLIGNNLYTVVGITDAEPDLDRYEILKEYPEEMEMGDLILYYVAQQELSSERENSLSGIAIVGPGWIERQSAEGIKAYPVRSYLTAESQLLDEDLFIVSYEENEPVRLSLSLTRLGKLADNADRVAWLDGTPRLTLNENEMVLPAHLFQEFVNYKTEDGSIPDGYYENKYADLISRLQWEGNTSELDLTSLALNVTVNGKEFKVVGLYFADETREYADPSTYSDVAILPDTFVDRYATTDQGFARIYGRAFGVMPPEKSNVRALVEYCYEGAGDHLQFPLQNPVCNELDMADVLFKTIAPIFLWIGVGFAVFAGLLLSNFISTSIVYKKQQIGILRAIGSRGNDVFRIFFAESFIIAMINFVLSSLGTFAVVSVINLLVRQNLGILVTVLSFGLRQIALLFAVSILVAFAASFLPVKKIASKKPIDAIRNR